MGLKLPNFNKNLSLLVFALLIALSLPLTISTVLTKQEVRQRAQTADTITIISASDFQGAQSSLQISSDLAISMNPDYVISVGDTTSEGTLASYQTKYTPSWGRMMSKIYPAPGNHDYSVAGAADYLQYFSSRIGGKLYYSVNLGAWHIVSLDANANIPAQVAWLQQDLAANPNKPILAFWHQPLFSADSTHGNSAFVKPFWDVLYAAHADIVVNGHVHSYQRYAQMDGAGNKKADGIREFVDGKAADGAYTLGTNPNLEFSSTSVPSFIKFTLSPTSYSWAYVKGDGSTLDAGSAQVHNVSAATTTPSVTSAPTPTEKITPTWFCAGGVNCVLTSTPTPAVTVPTQPTGASPIDASPTAPIAISPTTDPCTTQTVRENRSRKHKPKHKKHKNGGVGNMMKFFLQLIEQLLNMLIKLLGGGTINITPPDNTVPTAEPTNGAEPTQPDTSLPTAAPEPTTNPCPSLSPAATEEPSAPVEPTPTTFQATSTSIPTTPSPTTTGSSTTYILTVIPDSQYSVQNWPSEWMSNTKWIADNAAVKNIKYVLHEGDITNVANDTQYTTARAGLDQLDGKVPYILAMGNHDLDGGDVNLRGSTFFNTYFPLSKFQSWSTFVSSYPTGKNDDSFHSFSAGGTDWGIIALKYGPAADDLNWANTAVSANPSKRFIIVTHEYLSTTGNRTAMGERVWTGLVSKHKNISYVFSGHLGAKQAIRVDNGANGNPVYQWVADFQNPSTADPNTYLRFLTFDPTAKSVDVKTYSPKLNKYITDSTNQFTLTDAPMGPIN